MLERLEARAAAVGAARARGSGGGAKAGRAGPPRRGQPGADGAAPPARSGGPACSTRAAGRARRDEAAREPGHEGAARPRPPAAADGARRPRAGGGARRPRPRARPPRPAHARTLELDPDAARPATGRRARDLPRRAGGADECGAPLGREAHRRQPRPVDSRVVLEVSDDGRGFAFADEGKGLGLSGMRERALLVDGTLEIDSRPGRARPCRLEVPDRMSSGS